MKADMKEVQDALLDVLDMLGAISGGAHKLHGWGLSEHRQLEIWELGQKLIQEESKVVFDDYDN